MIVKVITESKEFSSHFYPLIGSHEDADAAWLDKYRIINDVETM